MIWLAMVPCASGWDRPGGVYDVCLPQGWEKVATSWPFLLAVWVGVMAWAIWTERRKDRV